MKAEIITIGDEILIGQIVDTNSAWIAARLNEAGFTVVRKLTVGDDRREIADAVEGAMRTADAVIVTGGLGPTKDDITKQTLAGIFGGEMVRDRETYERNGRILAARGIEYNELNREQATVPSSAEVLQNMHGTAPGMWFTRGGKAVVSLPGVPFEMKELMETEVMPRLAAHFRQSKVVHRTAITYGLAESVLAATIAEWEAALPGYLHLAYLPSPSQIRLRLSAYDIEGRREEEEIERQRTGADCPEPRSLHDGQLLGRIRGARTRQIVSRTPVPRPDELRHRPEGLQRVFALFAGMSHERHQRGTQTALFDRPDGLHQVRHLYGQM